MPFSCLVNVRVQGADYSDWKNRESVTLFRPEGARSVYQNIQNPPLTPYALYKSRQAEVQKAFFFMWLALSSYQATFRHSRRELNKLVLYFCKRVKSPLCKATSMPSNAFLPWKKKFEWVTCSKRSLLEQQKQSHCLRQLFSLLYLVFGNNVWALAPQPYFLCVRMCKKQVVSCFNLFL